MKKLTNNKKHKKQRNKLKSNKGITLIALVITIIILLILAGVSIAMLTGDNGILTQAQRAKNETEQAQVNEENILTDYEEVINNSTLDTAKVGEVVTGENKQYSKNGKAIIPVGFAIVPGFDNVEEGLVISDVANDTENNGNQFVWVPVPDFTEFKREHFGTAKQKWWTGTFVTDQPSEYNLYEPMSDGEANGTEVEKMYRSVKYNGGFYIGRYEAGKNAEKAISKKNAEVYNNIIWEGDEITTEGAVEKARNFCTESGHTNITSTLVYGVQWDAVMRWLSNGTEKEQEWLIDSTGKGNYLDNDDSNNPAKTGVNDEYQIKNIYDLAGNVQEWTMEADSFNNKIFRGGSYSNNGSSDPCSFRRTDGEANKFPTTRFSNSFVFVKLKDNISINCEHIETKRIIKNSIVT